MKNLYENYNDLLEAVEKLGFDISRLNANRAVVFGPGVIPYTRTNRGWERGGNNNEN
jgi:hypothetical protein